MIIPVVGQELQPSYVNGEDLLKDLRTIPEVQEVIQTAEKICLQTYSAPLQVVVENFTLNGISQCMFKRNVISIVPSISGPEQRFGLLYELINIVVFSGVKPFGIYASSEEAYAKWKESVEFKTYLKSNQLMSEVNQRCGYDFFINNVCPYRGHKEIDFESFYNDYLHPLHKEGYRNEYRELTKLSTKQFICICIPAFLMFGGIVYTIGLVIFRNFHRLKLPSFNLGFAARLFT